MTKVRTTLTIDPEVLRPVKVRAARLGKGDSDVIEEALRRDLGLDMLDRLWAASDHLPLARRLGSNSLADEVTSIGSRPLAPTRHSRPDQSDLLHADDAAAEGSVRA